MKSLKEEAYDLIIEQGKREAEHKKSTIKIQSRLSEIAEELKRLEESKPKE